MTYKDLIGSDFTLPQRLRPVDIVGISESMEGAVLVYDYDETEDINLEPLTQHREIFLIGAERE